MPNAARVLLVVAGLLLLALGWATAHAAPGSTVDPAALERVERYVAALQSARAEFTQTLTDADGKVLQEADGTLYLQKPGLFRWEYRRPAGQLIVADGANLWLYDADLAQVTVKAAGKALASSPAMLLAGSGSVADAFAVVAAGREGGRDWVRLTPRIADSDFRGVRLAFEGGELVAMELEDRLRQRTRLEFTRLERNPRLDAGLFTFTPPPGVDVVGSPARR